MHDIRALRADPAAYDAAWALRGLPPQTPAILQIDRKLRAAQTALQEAQGRRNEASKLIGQAKGRKDEAEAQRLMVEVEALKGAMTAHGEAEKSLGAELDALLAALPNLPADDVPVGEDEHGNVEQRRWGHAPLIANPKDHVALGEGMGLMDFEAAARTSGARFVFLKGELARLERALGAFMLDIHTGTFGYTEFAPPVLVQDNALFGTNQLPKFEEDLFFTTTEPRFGLIPTAEVSLTNYVADEILTEAELPLRFTAFTPCFRAEAGSAGRDTRGMIRMHQFSKVELVSITTPEQSNAEHERMTDAAQEVLKKLDLAHRVVTLCTGDMGFGARKTYDIEVWLPGQNAFREISSCSNCGDFQARRMNTRYRNAEGKVKGPVYTLNGSGLAVGRTMVAILENYQQADGSVAIPSALQPYMAGKTKIG